MAGDRFFPGHFPLNLEIMNMSDWVAIASYLSVTVAAIIFIFLALKIRKLMYKDDK